MYYEGFTNDSLIKLYEGVREALAADEAFTEIGGEGRFRVRKTPAWKLHAADLEAEMLRRGMTFEVIEWYEADHPVDEMLAPRGGGGMPQRIMISSRSPSVFWPALRTTGAG